MIGSPTLAAPMKPKVKSKKFGMRARNLETPPSPLLRRALSPEHEKAATDLFGSAPRSRADSGLDCVPIADIEEDLLEPIIKEKEPVKEKEKSIKEKFLKDPKPKQKLKRSGNVMEP